MFAMVDGFFNDLCTGTYLRNDKAEEDPNKRGKIKLIRMGSFR